MIEYEVSVGIAHGDTWREKQRILVAWCDENCNDYYVHDCYTYKMKFSFVNEQDAMAFKLRWL